MSDTTTETSAIPGKSLQCEYGLMEALGFIVLWVIITVVTLGIGSFFATYYFFKSVVNKTYVVDAAGNKTGRLVCDLNLAEIIGNIIIWILITIITLGIGLLFYVFRIFRLCLNKTTIQPI